MSKQKIWLSPPHMSGEEIKYIEEAFITNWISPMGPNIDNFEADLSKYLKIKHVAALNSGTSAIHLALLILGVKRGDLVICSSFTFSASVNPVTYIGATPILIDSEKDTWNMDPALLEMAIRDYLKKGKKPKAIILVHLYGMPARLDDILDISKKYDIPVIEDAAEALGSRYHDKPVGTFGEIGVLSFNGNKIITTSGGGALISDNKEYITRAKFYATQARDDAPYYQHSEVGYNYRMSNIVAGIGRGQIKVLDDRIRARRGNYMFYKDILGKLAGIEFQTELPGHFSNYWLTTVLIDPERTGGITHEDIRIEFEKKEIEVRPLWKPMHLQPVYRKAPGYVNGTSEKLFQLGLCLPSGSNLTIHDKERIVEIFLEILNVKHKVKSRLKEKENDRITVSFSPPRMDLKIIQSVVEALQSGWITTGPRTKEFEKKITDFCGHNGS